MLSLFTSVEQKTCKKAVDKQCNLENPNSYTLTASFPPTAPCPPPRTQPQLSSSYLAVQLPGSVVLLGTPSVKNGLVVHLDQLPFGAVAEVSKYSIEFIMTKIIARVTGPIASIRCVFAMRLA